jgi:hypothetical protein
MVNGRGTYTPLAGDPPTQTGTPHPPNPEKLTATLTFPQSAPPTPLSGPPTPVVWVEPPFPRGLVRTAVCIQTQVWCRYAGVPRGANGEFRESDDGRDQGRWVHFGERPRR